MPKTEAFDQHTNEYDNWFNVNKYGLRCYG